MKLKNILILCLMSFVLLAVTASAQPDLHWKVISSGGVKASSIGLQIDATVGQTSATFSSGISLGLQAGFWQNFGCCKGTRGDVNGDGTDNDVFDLTYLIDTIFRGGPPSPCLLEADLNGDGTPATVLDLTFIVDDIFRGGPAPGGC